MRDAQQRVYEGMAGDGWGAPSREEELNEIFTSPEANERMWDQVRRDRSRGGRKPDLTTGAPSYRQSREDDLKEAFVYTKWPSQNMPTPRQKNRGGRRVKGPRGEEAIEYKVPPKRRRKLGLG